MKKFYLIILLSLTINIQFIEFAQAVPGSFFRGIFKFFKGGTDDVIKNADDLIRNNSGQGNKIFKSEQEIDDLLKNLELDKSYKTAGSSQESLVLEKIGAESHLSEFKSLKESSLPFYVKKLKNKNSRLRADDLLEVENFFENDLFDNLFNNPSAENDTFYKFILLNWIGKIYYNSRYYNNPVNENRILLVCSNLDQVFYFSLFMEKEPRRVFLSNHKKFTDNNKILPAQELFVTEDSDYIKIMSTKPKKGNEWPSHYFTIYQDQNFYYDHVKLGNISPEIIKNKVKNNPTGKNNCSKATNEGLL